MGKIDNLNLLLTKWNLSPPHSPNLGKLKLRGLYIGYTPPNPLKLFLLPFLKDIQTMFIKLFPSPSLYLPPLNTP